MCEGLAVDYVCFKWQSSGWMLCTTCATVCVSERFVECVLNCCQFYTFVHVFERGGAFVGWQGHILSSHSLLPAAMTQLSALPVTAGGVHLQQTQQYAYLFYTQITAGIMFDLIQHSRLFSWVAEIQYMLDSELALHIIKAILHRHNPPVKHCFKLN